MAHAGFPNGLGESLEETIAGIKNCETSYQNQGYGSKLIWMLITYLFEDETLNVKFSVHRIILDTNLKNERAQHVYEKIGFTRVRVNYGAWEDQRGVLQDSVDYEMTREQFEQLKMK